MIFQLLQQHTSMTKAAGKSKNFIQFNCTFFAVLIALLIKPTGIVYAASTCGGYSGSTVTVTGPVTTACEINSGDNLTITTSGSVITPSYASAGQSAVQLNDANVLINNGTIDATNFQRPLLIMGVSGSSILNTGVIINSSASESGIKNTGNILSFTNTPGLTPSETALVSAPQVAISNAYGSIGSIFNDGSIISTRTANYGDAYGVLNFGTIGLLQNKANGLIQSQGTSDTSTTGLGDSAIANVWSGSITTIENQSDARITGAVVGISNGASFETAQESTIAHIVNSGEISGTANGLGVGIFNNGGISDISNTSNSLGNNGLITGKYAGLVNATYGVIGTITNNANASISGGSLASSNTYGIGNDGVITSIKNYGYITGGNTGISNTGSITEITNYAAGVIAGNQAANAVGIYNTSTPSGGGTTPGVIGTITNAGTIVSYGANGVGIDNTTGTSITTLNNAQGKGNADGPLTYKGTLPSYYNIIINNPNSFGRLKLLSSPAGLMTFDIYGSSNTSLVTGVNASSVTAGTYSDVLQGFSTLNGISGVTGTYSGLNYSLVADTAGSCLGCWNLVFASNSTNIINGSGNYLSAVGASLNPVFAGGTLTLLNGDNSNQNFAIESTGGTISAPTTGSATLGGVFSGSGAMTFNGSGTTYMNGINTYTGGTTVASGTLSVGSSEAYNTARLAGDVTVQAAGTLAGHGGIAGTVINSGTVAPGGSIGTLSVGGNYVQTSVGTLSTSITPSENSVLAVSGKATIAGNFAIDASAGVYTKRSYTVLTSSGLTGKFSNVSGNLASYSPLGTYLSYDANNAYLELVASRADTQQSLVNAANVLQGIYTLQNAVLVNGFSYDCNLFGANDVCISAGGRNTSVQAEGMNNTSALLIAAYRPAPNYRVGAWADQNLSMNSPGGTVKLGNNTPVLGLFGAWNEKLDGSGTEIKVAAGYGQKNATVTRAVVGTSDAGSGSSNLTTQGAQLQAKYGYALLDNTMISPYVGVRYTQSNMGGYSEGYNANVTAPLTYQALNTNATTAIAGVGVSYKPIPVVALLASAGVEMDTSTSNGSYSASSVKIAGLTPINFNANPVKTRPTATVGAYYDVEKHQRLGVTGIYRQEPYQAVSTTTVMATYTVGL